MGVNYEGDVEETDKDVHNGDGKEEEVMSSVEIWAFLDTGCLIYRYLFVLIHVDLKIT